MSTKLYWFCLFSIISISTVSSQMVIGPDTLVGNEWIRYGAPYYKFTVNADGICRIHGAALQAAGIDLASNPGSTMRLYNMGRQVPIYLSTDNAFTETDFIEFYGYRNRSEMDRYLFLRPDTDLLNPDHSLYTDNNPYYLTFDPATPPVRVNQLTNDVSGPPPPADYYLHDESYLYTVMHFDPYFPAEGGGAVTYSSYWHGEGFGSDDDSGFTATIPSTHVAPTGPDATLHLRMTTTNRIPNHEFRVTFNGQPLDTIRVANLRIIDTVYVIPRTAIQANNEFKITSKQALSLFSVSGLTLQYPRVPDANDASHISMQAPTSLSDFYYVLQHFSHSDTAPILYSADGSQRMIGAFNGNNDVHFVWPAVAGNPHFVVDNAANGINTITTLTPKTFADISADDTELVIITHPDLMNLGTESEYALYRNSPQGGSFKTKAYSILDLYDEFGYGIEKHPQAIRNFVEYMTRHWPDTRMIYIIGRGIEYNRSRYENGSWEPFFFVPTFGKPGADNLLAARNWNLIPRYPVTRLAVTNPTEISEYLAKVKEHDAAILEGAQTLEDKSWIKHVIHIAGGKKPDEQEEFKETLTELGEQLAVSDFGARVFHFQKESSDVISESQSKQIERLLREGSSIINYLGHSSANTFEYTINDAAEWNNRGRYPVFSAMGCSAGQIHGPVHGLSDRYVLIPNEGAIAFISGSGSQYPGALIAWATPWYRFLGETNYGGLLGESNLTGLKSVGNFVDPLFIGFNIHRFLLEQQTYQGDPAIRLNPLPGPDYLIDRKTVSLTPDLLNTDLDSFSLQFSVHNIGRNLRQPTAYTIKLRFPEGNEMLLVQDTFSASRFENVIAHRIAMPTDIQPGSYRLLIEVDPENDIEELPAPFAENNNRLEDQVGVEGIPVVFVSNVITAIYPPDYAIVNKAPVLIATGSNPFGHHLNIRIELDTTTLFNSPLHLQENFTDHDALLKWSPLMNWQDDQVYYWRVSYDSLSPEQPFYWSHHSFIYKPGSSPGWNQSHFYQLNENELQQIEPDSANWSFDFGTTVYNFRLLNRYQKPAAGELPFGYIDNIFLTEFFTKFANNNVHVFVAAVDPVTGDFIMNPTPGLYGSFNNLNYDIHCFPFNTDTPEGRKNVMDFINNMVPEGFIVFLYTYQRDQHPSYFPELWAADEAVYGQSIFSLVESQYPNSQIRSLATTGSKPYIVQFIKNGGPVNEVIAVDTADVISLSYDIKRSLMEGAFVSTLIGPASQWHSIHWDIEEPQTDTAGIHLLSAYALTADLQDTLWISHNLQARDTVIETIAASEYPFMQLKFQTGDSLQRDPADIFYWRVLYEGYPEFIFTTEPGFEFVADTLFQGEDMRLHTYVENLSDYAAINVPVTVRILGGDNTDTGVHDTIPHLAALSSAPVSFTKSTKELEGDYQVIAEINADRNLQEVTYANNIGILPMHVLSDKVNPVLDVTFDGYHIRNGDLVAAKPLISILLHDENNFLRIDDTSSFSIYLKYPSDTEARYVAFTNDWVTFIPSGTSGKNQAIVELRPHLHEDGIYELQVQARDASGNDAGDNEYLVAFNVMHQPAVSYIYNFPNPFRTSTRFVYTLTGESSPADYRIQIVSVTGQIIKEISREELGPLAVGTHATSYEWDGTDSHGNQLGGGVYFYHMMVKDENGDDYRHYEQFSDALYSKKGWGKLMIIR